MRALVSVLMLCAGTWNAQAKDLLRPAASLPSAEQRLQLEMHTSAMRWRLATMDNDESFRAGPSSGPLVLDLFHDVPMRAQENLQRRTLRR